MINYYEKIKQELLNNEISKLAKRNSINNSDLTTYYNVGKMLSEAGKSYGENIIGKYSVKLTQELGKKYNTTTLKRMRQFYLLIEKGARFGHQLSWSHYVELLPLKDNNEINYYINICEKELLTRDELRNRIKSKEYERLSEETKNKLITNEELKLPDLVPNPIMIPSCDYIDINSISEKYLQETIMLNISSFLRELGNGFSFIDNEYKIKIGNNYNYIDLLLYNVKFKCYVVVELKVTVLKKEHIGQIKVYMNYIDKNVKELTDNKTIGIIICSKNNQFIIEYSSDERIFAREFKLESKVLN